MQGPAGARDGELSGKLEDDAADDGAGFDFAEILRGSMDENFSRHGRGIALARLMSFDDLRWEGRGNRVIGRISA